MNNGLNCTKCGSEHIVLQKKGYDLKYAFYFFISISISLAMGWCCLFAHQNTINTENSNFNTKEFNRINNFASGTPMPELVDYSKNKFLVGGTILLLLLSPLYGFFDANEYDIICISCRTITPLKERSNTNAA